MSFSHVNREGQANMVNVGHKEITRRTAKASGSIFISPETVVLIRENSVKKGDVLTAARFAGIQAAKETSRLIPLCHPLLLDHIELNARLLPDQVEVISSVSCNGRTGVEMEALTAVSTALLTVYDMCKAADKNMKIGNIRLLEKTSASVD